MPAEPGKTRRQACLEMLRKIRRSLTDEGVLLLAIENRLGAKYWAGCGEDHTTRLVRRNPWLPGRYADHVQPGRTRRAPARGRFREPAVLPPPSRLQAADDGHPRGRGPRQCTAHQWTQSSRKTMQPREYLMPDPLLMKSLEYAGLLWQFSNSFLVLCSPSRKSTCRGLAHKEVLQFLPTGASPYESPWRSVRAPSRERRPMRAGSPTVDLGQVSIRIV